MTTRVKIEMWNVGVGDCFLLTFDTDGSLARVLIDCGTHNQSQGPRKAAHAARDIVARLRAAGTPRLDVVVATHRHEDHISGFGDAELWKGVEVGQVWLPWTEEDKNPQAIALRERQERLRRAMLAMSAHIADGARRNLVQEILLEGFTAAPSLRTLKKSMGCEPRYLAVGSQVGIPTAPQVKVQVLGPSRDTTVIGREDPTGAGKWLAAMEDSLSLPELRPFAATWSLGIDEAERTSGLADLMPAVRLRETIDGVLSDDLLQAASTLGNNTSIVLVFSVGGLVLVFPGDAQWGTWEMILGKPENVALLEQTDFLKVGHHGSLNATPPALIKQPILRKGTVAAISVGLGKWSVTDLDKVTPALRDYGLNVFLSEDPSDNIRREFEFLDDTDSWTVKTIMQTPDGEQTTVDASGNLAASEGPLQVTAPADVGVAGAGAEAVASAR